jgi:Type II secretion system (T2SS), protein N
MPTSPSPRRGGKVPPPVAPGRSLWPRVAVIVVLAVAAVLVSALPASWVTRLLPPSVRAEDFSGTLWHGSAGHVTVNSRDAGALEWRLHPLALFTLHLAADLHWVKGSFVLDGGLDADRGDLSLSNFQGGGPIGDLRDLGVAPGWAGSATVRLQQLSAELHPGRAALKSATGEISVSDLTLPQLAQGANLGGYVLKFSNPAITPDTDAAATLTDTGGPLSVDAAIQLSLKNRTGLFSGAVKERPDTPPALRSELANLAQLHARDAQGRIPVDLEFTF